MRRRSHSLRKRYARARTPPGITVTKVHLFGGRGVGTKVILEDGYTITFVGPSPIKPAIDQARRHRAQGYKSEAP